LIQELADKAYNEMSTVLPEKAQLLASFFEMITEMGGALKRATSLVKKWTEAQPIYEKTLKDLVSSGIDRLTAADLAFEWVLMPLFADAVALRCSMHRAQKRLRWLTDHNHKFYRTNFRRRGAFKPSEFPPVILGGPGVYYEGPWFSGVGGSTPLGHDIPALYKAEVVSYNADYHASSTGIFHIEMYKLSAETLWQQEMGLYNLTGAIWEATPFSWLVDWFTSAIKDVTGVIDANLQPVGRAELSHACSSWKIDVLYNVFCENTALGEREFLGVIQVKRYIRNPGLAIDPTVLSDPLRLPDRVNQLTTGTSVLWNTRPSKWRRYCKYRTTIRQ